MQYFLEEINTWSSDKYKRSHLKQRMNIFIKRELVLLIALVLIPIRTLILIPSFHISLSNKFTININRIPSFPLWFSKNQRRSNYVPGLLRLTWHQGPCVYRLNRQKLSHTRGKIYRIPGCPKYPGQPCHRVLSRSSQTELVYDEGKRGVNHFETIQILFSSMKTWQTGDKNLSGGYRRKKGSILNTNPLY